MKIEIDRTKKQALVTDLQRYLADELDTELGQFDAEFLFDFITAKFAPVYFNEGLAAAQKVFERRMLDVSDELYEIEMQEEN